MTKLNKSVTKSHPWTPSLRRIHSLNINDKQKEILADLVIKAYLYNNIGYEMVETRKRIMVETHCVLATVIKDYFNVPLVTIGKVINKHHATVLHYNKLYDEVLCIQENAVELYNKLSDYAKYRIYGSEGYKNYDVEGADNKELKKTCRELLIANKMLTKQLAKVKEAFDAL